MPNRYAAFHMRTRCTYDIAYSFNNFFVHKYIFHLILQCQYFLLRKYLPYVFKIIADIQIIFINIYFSFFAYITKNIFSNLSSWAAGRGISALHFNWVLRSDGKESFSSL